ncbi:hypothetical protein BFW01_g7562 [Lasiodiplodia theobromae]|nr:hypothetical protein BFW01_g7562 [Lasiodiplodia theobromae]
MSDPLSIAASVIAVVHTAKQLYYHIQHLTEAPENLRVAGGDLQATVAILESLEHHTRTDTNETTTAQSLLCQESALTGVLSSCRLTCNDFQTRLKSCAKHSQNGRFSIRDRVATTLKDQEIKKFREDLNSHREIIGLRISVLDLLTTSESHSALIDFQQKNQAAIKNIERQLEELNVTLAGLQRIPGLYNEAAENALENEKTALHQRLRVCNENMAANSQGLENKQDFEKNKVGDNSDSVMGGLGKEQTVIKNDQKFHGNEIGNSSKSTMGCLGKKYPLQNISDVKFIRTRSEVISTMTVVTTVISSNVPVKLRR